MYKNLLQELIDAGELLPAFTSRDPYESFNVPSKTFVVCGTALFLQVYLDGRKELNQSNCRWYTEFSVEANRYTRNISHDEIFGYLKKIKKDNLLKLLIYNLDEYSGS